MTAREMFKQLGYGYRELDDDVFQYSMASSIVIRFYKKEREFCSVEYFEPKNITVDEFKAIQQQLKELGWIEPEQKQETNYEHFKDEMVQNIKYNLAVVNGEPKPCEDTNCDECDFNNCDCCGEKRFEWLASPYKKPTYKLTKFEYDLLNAHKDSGMQKCLSNYRPLLELNEKGYFKYIDTNIPIHEILDNCEVIK